MRPLKYGEEMIRLDVRIPVSAVGDFRVMVKEFLRKRENVGKAKKEVVNEPKVIKTTKLKWQLDAEERMKRNKV